MEADRRGAPGERSPLAWAGPNTGRSPSTSGGTAKVHGPRPATTMCTISAGISLQLRRVSSAFPRSSVRHWVDWRDLWPGASSRPGTFASLTLVDITPQMEANGVARVLGFMAQHAREGFESPEHASASIAAYLPHRERRQSSSGLKSYIRKGPGGRYYWHWDQAFVENITRRRTISDDVTATSTELLQAASALSLPVHLVRGGSSDLVSPEGAAEFRKLVPHTQFSDIAGASHMVAGDDNDAFGDAVQQFLVQTHRAKL